MHFCARCSILSCNSALSIRRIDTAELHRVYDNMLQRAQNCVDVQGDHFQHLLYPVSTLHVHLFNFLYRVRDLRPRWSTRRRAGFSCAILYYDFLILRVLNCVSRQYQVIGSSGMINDSSFPSVNATTRKCLTLQN